MRKIVVGVDGSDGSKRALRFAVEEARAHGARVVALHSWQPPVLAVDVTPMPPPDIAAEIGNLHENALRLVTAVVEEVVGDDSSVSVEAVAVEGPAASALVDAARDADLLVMGSRGLGGFAGLLLGSVSQQCVQHATCPVVIHRTMHQ
jgi:nucleotide-binding universal stress UspA family protein